MPDSPLDRPRISAHAWARYRRLMKLMTALTLVLVIGALGFFYFQGEPLPLSFYVATGFGIAGAMLLTSALMGLVFLSDGTGYDDAVAEPFEDDRQP